MKKSLAELLSPGFDYYRSIGELARTLQFLLSTYRDKGRWGASGPHEPLINYDGCTNCLEKAWHSSRITTTRDGRGNLTTWQQNHDAIYSCILNALCNEYPTFQRWRKDHGIHLYMSLKFPMAYQHQDHEQAAWLKFMSMHGFKLPAPTYNSCHRRVNLLAWPQLIISRGSVSIQISITDRQEIRSICGSRWDASFLTREDYPRWRCQRETFADFLLRAITFCQTLQPRELA